MHAQSPRALHNPAKPGAIAQSPRSQHMSGVKHPRRNRGLPPGARLNSGRRGSTGRKKPRTHVKRAPARVPRQLGRLAQSRAALGGQIERGPKKSIRQTRRPPRHLRAPRGAPTVGRCSALMPSVCSAPRIFRQLRAPGAASSDAPAGLGRRCCRDSRKDWLENA